jgi:hypothetical protein
MTRHAPAADPEVEDVGDILQARAVRLNALANEFRADPTLPQEGLVGDRAPDENEQALGRDRQAVPSGLAARVGAGRCERQVCRRWYVE